MIFVNFMGDREKEHWMRVPKIVWGSRTAFLMRGLISNERYLKYTWYEQRLRE